MSKRERNWRPSLLSIADVEYELRVSQSKFTEWMAQGWMPQPWIKEGGVTRWRTSDILDAIENFPNRAELDAERAQQVANNPGRGRAPCPWADQRAR